MLSVLLGAPLGVVPLSELPNLAYEPAPDWTHVFTHKAVSGRWPPGVWRLRPEDSSSYQYSILDELFMFRDFQTNQYTFRLEWPSRGLKYEWHQTTNPASDACDAPVVGYAPMNATAPAGPANGCVLQRSCSTDKQLMVIKSASGGICSALPSQNGIGAPFATDDVKLYVKTEKPWRGKVPFTLHI